MAKTFDPTQPYAEIWGAGLHGYEQDGQMYSTDGTPMDTVPVAVSGQAETGETEGNEPETEQEAPVRSVRSLLGEKSDSELRAMVQISGGRYTTRSAAITYLEAQQEK